MKHTVHSISSIFVSLAISLLAAAIVWALWVTGLLASIQAVFVYSKPAYIGDLVEPQIWLAGLLIATAGLCSGFAVQREGGKRAFLTLSASIGLFLGINYAAAWFFAIDILFAPIWLSAMLSACMVQARRLWTLDKELAFSIRTSASHVNALEGVSAEERLLSGLRLLDTVLPLDEAIVFKFDEEEKLAPGGRLRHRGSMAEMSRNSVWREGVQLCEKAIKKGETLVSESADQSSVALPLRHEGHDVGALLVRLREKFDENDRPLLAAVGAQLARNLQRDEARKHPQSNDLVSFLSVTAAERRLGSFGVVSGLLTEQRFGAEVLSQVSDGNAVAYLDGTLAYVNPEMIKAAQIEENQGWNLNLFTLLDRFRTGVFDEPSIAVRRVLQTGTAYERELNYPDRNQTLGLRIGLATERNLTTEKAAQPLCIVVNVRDVTRMKEYDKMRSDMASLMSHELRTPITSINGFAELLALDDSIPEESREFLNIIVSESQRLVRMINTFLAVTQLQQGDKQDVLKIPLKLDDVVRETIANLHSSAKKKRIRLVEGSSSRLPPVAADKSLITQVVTNLVDNAIRYSPERTTVMVSAQLEADTVRVSVEDRGFGIPPEAIDRVWDKFYRVARDGHEKEEGSTGLGLSFVREIVEQHGGAVSLESEVGRGSRFSFTLPRL